MIDLLIHETGDGGDISLLKNDLATTGSFFNMIYIALFGGNIEASTTGKELLTEKRFDYWGNALLMPNEKSIQFNSETERRLNNVALDSNGRIEILNSVNADLAFLSTFGEVTVEVLITDINRISINVSILEPDNIQQQDFQFIWDASRKEILKTLT